MSEYLRGTRARGAIVLVGAVVSILWVTGRAAADQQLSDVVSSVAVEISLETQNEDANEQQYFINLEDCEELVQDDPGITFTWRFDRDPPSSAQFTIKVQKNDETCALSSLTTETTDDCLTLEQQTSLSSRSITRQFDFSEIVSDLEDAADCGSAHGNTWDVALVFTTFTTTTSDTEDDTDLDEVRFEFVTERPSSPREITVEAGESSIEVDWAEVTDAERYWVYYSTTELTAGADPSAVDARDKSTTTPGAVLSDNILRNTTYWIAVTAEDEFGNESLLSTVVTATTQQVTDFFEYYRQMGGQETGGYCSAVGDDGGGPSSGWLILLAAVIAGRRRQRWS